MINFDSSMLPELTTDRGAVRPSRSSLPTISIVSVAGADLAETIRRMSVCYARWGTIGVELIVICSGDQSDTPGLNGGPRVIHGPADATDSQLRAIGLAEASGDLVMLLDDPANADDEWIEHLSSGGRRYGSPLEADVEFQESFAAADRELFATEPSV